MHSEPHDIDTARTATGVRVTLVVNGEIVDDGPAAVTCPECAGTGRTPALRRGDNNSPGCPGLPYPLRHGGHLHGRRCDACQVEVIYGAARCPTCGHWLHTPEVS